MTTNRNRRRYGVIETRYRHHGGIAHYDLSINGELWACVEWSPTRRSWCIQDASGRCLAHCDAIHGENIDAATAVQLAKSMIRDGRIPTPEEAERQLEQRLERNRLRPARLAAMIHAAGGGMVMLVGVQSNQFPRALDLARPLRAAGILVGIGGFHVSGVLSMLNGVDADLEKVKAMGARRRCWPPCAALQFHGRAAVARGHTDPVASRGTRAAYSQRRHQLPCRTRLPLPVLVLTFLVPRSGRIRSPSIARC